MNADIEPSSTKIPPSPRKRNIRTSIEFTPISTAAGYSPPTSMHNPPPPNLHDTTPHPESPHRPPRLYPPLTENAPQNPPRVTKLPADPKTPLPDSNPARPSKCNSHHQKRKSPSEYQNPACGKTKRTLDALQRRRTKSTTPSPRNGSSKMAERKWRRGGARMLSQKRRNREGILQECDGGI